MQTGTPLAPAPAPLALAGPGGRRESAIAAAHAAGMARLQCTAVNQGPVVNEQCSTVLRQTGNQWKYKLHRSDCFCGVAMVESSQMQASAAQ